MAQVGQKARPWGEKSPLVIHPLPEGGFLVSDDTGARFAGDDVDQVLRKVRDKLAPPRPVTFNIGDLLVSELVIASGAITTAVFEEPLTGRVKGIERRLASMAVDVKDLRRRLDRAAMLDRHERFRPRW
jgi:hypothetical protein